MANLPAVQEVRNALEKMAPQFKAALPGHVSVEKFVRVTLTAVQTNPQLLNADRRTLFAAATKAAQMGLMPDGREGAIVTFKDQAQWMPMVAGVMKLVRNSGEISTWSVQAVYENDQFDFCLGDDEHITHKPALANRGKLIAVYSIVTMKDGEKSREVMSVEDVESIRKRSRSGGSGPWVTDFAEMAKKTVVRRHSKRLPLSTDIDGVVHEDDALFMPPEPAPTPEEPEQAPAPKRPSRLQKVAAQAPADDGPAFPPVDDDGVIDVPHTDVTDHQPVDNDNDSPI
jgi:recombination protein RecT